MLVTVFIVSSFLCLTSNTSSSASSARPDSFWPNSSKAPLSPLLWLLFLEFQHSTHRLSSREWWWSSGPFCSPNGAFSRIVQPDHSERSHRIVQRSREIQFKAFLSAVDLFQSLWRCWSPFRNCPALLSAWANVLDLPQSSSSMQTLVHVSTRQKWF